MTRQSWFVTLTAASTVLLALLLFAFLREGPPVPGASAPSDHLRVISPAPPRPVPDDLVTAHEEIVRLQRAEEFEKAAEEYYALLRHLAGRWGESNPDLAPYYYNFAYILKSAGRVTDCEGVLLAARDKWPDSLQLQLFDATLRAEVSLAIGRLDPELDGLFATLLRDDNLPRIRGLRVDPMVLFAQRAELLLRADRRVDATRVVDRALGIDGSDLALRRLRARLLLANQKAAAARELLEELTATDDDPDLRFLLGTALLDEGRPERALEYLLPLVEELASAETSSDGAPTSLSVLRVRAARALGEVGRFRGAAELLLDALLADPRDTKALRELAVASRGLGAVSAANALERRARAMESRDTFARLAEGAKRAARPSSVAYHRAQAALVVEDIGEALALLGAGVELPATVAQLHLELTRVEELLGRRDRAEHVVVKASESSDSSALYVVERARLAAADGRAEDARRWLIDERLTMPTAEEQDSMSAEERQVLALVMTRRLLTYYELGEFTAAAEFFRRYRVTSEDPGELLLCRAELALVEGRLDEADGLLAGSFDEVPGGIAWQRALQTLIAWARPAAARGDSSPVGDADPSDLLGRPRFLTKSEYTPRAALDAEVARELDRQRALHHRARELLEGMRGHEDRDVVDRWAELIDLYRAAGALRKAREAAWYALSLEPNRVESYRRLVRVLERPQDAIERLAVIETGLRRAGDDPELAAARNATRSFLGLPPAAEGSPAEKTRG